MKWGYQLLFLAIPLLVETSLEALLYVKYIEQFPQKLLMKRGSQLLMIRLGKPQYFSTFLKNSLTA